MTSEKRAYLMLKKQNPTGMLTRYAGLVWRTRRYARSSNTDSQTGRVMRSLYKSLLKSPLRKNVLEVLHEQ